MAKSRNRSRDIRKRAAKKRANKIRLQKKMDEIYLETNRMMDAVSRIKDPVREDVKEEVKED